MSYGTERGFKTKKALQDAVKTEGADRVGVFGTSMFGNEKATTVADLADDPAAVIVGPDVYRNRKWYANVKRKADGTIVVV